MDKQSDITIQDEERGDSSVPETIAPDEILRLLRRFYLAGEPAPQALPAQGLLPAPLHSYRDFAHVRSDYPVCLPEHDAPPVARPLTHIIDDLITRQAGEGDEGERYKRSLWKLEAGIRTLVDQGAEGRLSDLWEHAAADLAGRLDDSKKKAAFGEHVATARAALEVDGPLLGCASSTLLPVLDATQRALRARQTSTLREDVETLIQKLSDILAVDGAHSPEAAGPQGLQAAVGTPYAEEIDFDALAHVLEEAPHSPPLPEQRRARIQDALQTLRDLRSLYAPDDAPDAVSLFDHRPATQCRDAQERMRTRLDALASFFRAYHVARLEAENRYRPDHHDRLLARYAADSLTPEERALCPPLLVYLDDDAFDEADKNRLVALLSTRLPFKILVALDGVWDAHLALAEPMPLSGWRTRLGNMVAALQTAYVLQTTTSHLSHLVTGFDEGLRYDGPALFCVYTGAATDAPDLHPYLRSAVALDARAFPALIYHPEKGTTWAARFSIAANPQVERAWPVNALETDDDEEAPRDVPFTFVDFVACDAAFSDHFMPVPRSLWHPNMTPLGDYLDLDEAEDDERIPHIVMVDQDGALHRVVVIRALVEAARRIGDQWRSVQELGGINNSHALRLLDAEKGRLEEEKQQAVAEIERHYQAELDKTTGALAQEIVANIAAGLLGLPVSGSIAPTPIPLPKADEVVAKLPAAPETPTTEAAPVETEEEEEALSFDEAYVETPRCTSCNECTTINPRLFAYDANKQAYIKDLSAGTYRELVMAAELCPVRIIHPGKPQHPDEPGLDELLTRAEPFL